MFGKLFGGGKKGASPTSKPPTLRATNIDEAIQSALDYAAYQMFDNAGEIFIPSILQFKDNDTRDGTSNIRRFIHETEDGMIDIGEGVNAALAAFSTPADFDYEVVVWEAVQTLDTGEKFDCFIGYMRDNITGFDMQFSRMFADRGQGREWVSEVVITPLDPA